MTSHLAILFQTYEALNARDADTALAAMTEDVAWPDLWDDEGILIGHDALRRSWNHHWARIEPHFVVQGYLRLPDDRLHVELRHTVRSVEGDLVSDEASGHVYRFRDERIAAMEVA